MSNHSSSILSLSLYFILNLGLVYSANATTLEESGCLDGRGGYVCVFRDDFPYQCERAECDKGYMCLDEGTGNGQCCKVTVNGLNCYPLGEPNPYRATRPTNPGAPRF